MFARIPQYARWREKSKPTESTKRDLECAFWLVWWNAPRRMAAFESRRFRFTLAARNKRKKSQRCCPA